jgi:hypothetical protein
MMNTISEVEYDVVSVYEAASTEARRHSWIESQKHHRDVSEHALDEWYNRFWWTFLRYRHLEHLMGERLWDEFDHESFGLLQPFLRAHGDLAHELVERFRSGWENLDIINWATHQDFPMDEVYDCLVLINMNDARIDPQFNYPNSAQPLN